MERERGMDVFARRAQPITNAPRTSRAWVMWIVRLKREAKAKKLSMSCMVNGGLEVDLAMSLSLRSEDMEL